VKTKAPDSIGYLLTAGDEIQKLIFGDFNSGDIAMNTETQL
jgi:hypothetical protein